MSRLAWVLMPLAVGRLRASAERLRRRAVYLAVAGFLALVAVVFALVAVTAALASQVGLIAALLIMMAGAGVLALAVLLALRIGERRARARAGLLSGVPPQLYQSALFSTLGGLRAARAGRLVGIGLLLLSVVLLAARRDDEG